MSTDSHNECERVWNKLHQTLTREDWRGYDPYDGLNSPLARAIPGLRSSKTWRQAWIQFHRRSPVNFRPLVGVGKQLNPKTLALGISALCLRYRALGQSELLEEAVALASRLLELRSTQTKHLAWGYPFHWQSRAFYVPAGTPNMICTVFGASAMLDLYDATHQNHYLCLATQCCDFVLQDLSRSGRGESFCFSYTPLDQSCVHNVNLLGAALLARAGQLQRRFEWFKEAKRAVRFSTDAQAEDGSWPYGAAPNQTWVDGFHTGYNLVALQRYKENTADLTFQRHLEKGWRFYRERFFLEDGTPKYYCDAACPLDAHNAAQGIITFAEVGLDREGAERITHWALDNLWIEDGYFCYQKTRLWRNRIPYVRWTQAWMFLALARLLLLAR